MKYCVTTILLLCALTGISQKYDLNIHTIGGDTISTNWIELSSYPFLKKPFIRIDNAKGKKIPIANISYLEGYDQNNNFRKLKTYTSKRSAHFTEWVHSESKSEGLTIYQERLTFGETNTFPEFIIDDYYTFDSQEYKQLNLRNVKNDFKLKGIKSKNLQHAKNITGIQRIAQAVGVVLFTHYIVDITPNQGSEFLKEVKGYRFYICSSLIVLPIALNKFKKRKIIQALQESNH